MSYELLVSYNDQYPMTNYQLPITNYQCPMPNYQLPITTYLQYFFQAVNERSQFEHFAYR
ncbi:MAG: hypothetical protein HC941_18095 [Microcoleus sp. SU_5_3]|nr:hypothetical protein [Microcoleus sp. SU_5_3]